MKLHRFRFKLRQLMIAVAVVGLVVTGGLWLLRGSVDRSEIAPESERANTDHDLFDVVLSDLLLDSDFGGGRKLDPHAIIVVGSLTGRRINYAFLGLDSWVSENDMTAEILEDLRARNLEMTRFSPANYHPSNPRIQLRSLTQNGGNTEYSAEFPNARGIVVFHLPGYSIDGQSALIYFRFGPSPHGAAGFYFLRKINGRWDVIEKKICYYS